MPPKVRGRKKATVAKMEVDKKSNGHADSETLEITAQTSNGSFDENNLNGDIQNKLEINKEFAGSSNGESQTNKILEKDSNLTTKLGPLKRGRKKANVSEENIKQGTETGDFISDDENKEPSNKHKDYVGSTSSKTDTLDESPEDKKADDKSKPGTKIDICDDKNEPEKKEIPLKRGRQKKGMAEASEEIPTEQLTTEEKVPPKRGRKKPNPLQSGISPELKENEKQAIEEKTPDEQIQAVGEILDGKANISKVTEENNKIEHGRPRRVIAKTSDKQSERKVQPKRGQKNVSVLKLDTLANLKTIEEETKEKPIKKDSDEQTQVKDKVPFKRPQKKVNLVDSSKLKKVEQIEEVSSNVTKEHRDDENTTAKESTVPLKRGRKKANQKETIEELDEVPTKDMMEKEKSSGKEKAIATIANEKLESEELTSVRNKRKNEISSEEIEKNRSDFNKTKVLKVALHRDKGIDKILEVDQDKITEKGGTKNAKAGSKRVKGDGDSNENDVKSAKIPKSESKSKGQSKKDKMPDVTLLNFKNNSSSPSGKPWNLKISSWNVNGVRAWLEKDGLAYITHESPDIMAFQETKCSDKMLPSEINVAGYHSFWLAGDKDGYSGVGLLSREDPISVKYGIGVEEHDKEGRVITAEYKSFYLVTAYVPNAGRGLIRLNYRMQWDKDFRSYLKNLDEKKPVILCGDLNVAHEEIDLANPKSNKKNAGFTKEEREGFSTLLSEGFIDSFRALYPEEKGAYTFWTYMMNARAKNVGWRLDYFVLSKKFTDQLCDNVIRKDVYGSDHCPITLFLCV